MIWEGKSVFGKLAQIHICYGLVTLIPFFLDPPLKAKTSPIRGIPFYAYVKDDIAPHLRRKREIRYSEILEITFSYVKVITIVVCYFRFTF